MKTLFADRYFPTTETLGFIRAPAAHVAEEYVKWLRHRGDESHSTLYPESLERTLPLLEPLTGDPNRFIVASTTDSSWSAIFSNAARGNEPSSAIAVLSKALQTNGVLVSYVPDVPRIPGETLGRLGSCRFFYTEFDPRSSERIALPTRTIYLARQSGSKWLFEAKGEPLPFEETPSYARRKVRDRFTPEMLEAYCRAIGLDPFNAAFYPGPCHLIEKATSSPPRTVTTFREQQEKWQITSA